MTHVHIEGLTKRFAGKPSTVAMDDLSLDIEQGELVVLLGPSGCGKTTTLRCLAGLETPDEGRITFGDHAVFDSSKRINLSPDRRNVGMVFQSYALWPHMTVRKNIAYPITTRRHRRAARRLQLEASSWVEETAALVDCGGLLDRYPAQLSGGQQQRVALARGLVARPDVVLFDEPLSNLDARLRDSVRAQLHELHARLRFSAVFVTHDQAEALALADRLVVMRQGSFEQVGTPEEVFETPATEHVADFIGMSNGLDLVRGGGGGGGAGVDGSGWSLAGAALSGRLDMPGAEPLVRVRLRPEDVILAPTDAQLPPGVMSCPAVVADAQYGGRYLDVSVVVGAARVQARVPSGPAGGWARSLAASDEVVLGFALSAAHFFDSDGARLNGPVGPPLVSEGAAR